MAGPMEVTSSDGVLMSPLKEPTAPRNLPKRSKMSRDRSKIREIVSVLKFGPLARLVNRRRQPSKPQETGKPSVKRTIHWIYGTSLPDGITQIIDNLSLTAINTVNGEDEHAGQPGAGIHQNVYEIAGSPRYEVRGTLSTLL